MTARYIKDLRALVDRRIRLALDYIGVMQITLNHSIRIFILFFLCKELLFSQPSQQNLGPLKIEMGLTS